MAYHIKQLTVENGREHHQRMSYGNRELVKEIARLLSKFDPYTVYAVMNGEQELHTYWYGKEKPSGQTTETPTEVVSSMGAD